MANLAVAERHFRPLHRLAAQEAPDLLRWTHPGLAANDDYQQSLLTALLGLGIRPFEPATVAAYKRRQERKARCHVLYSNTIPPLILLTGIFGVCSILSVHRAHEELSTALGNAFIVSIILMVFGLLLTMGLTGTRKVLGWQQIAYGDYYHGGLPRFPAYVKESAERITRMIPGVRLEVDELKVKQLRADPFLVVQLGNETYYVEVWDEQSFRQDRMAV